MSSQDAPVTVAVEVLGPLRLLVDGVAVDVRGPKRRALLALLALGEGRTVPVDHLVDALWPSEPPESGRQALHTHVSRLRLHFSDASDRLQTAHDGYRLDLVSDALDVRRARSLLEAARVGAQSDPAGAFTMLAQAHALWQGPMLADLTDVAPIATAVEGFARLQRDVTDAMIASAIDAGRAAAVLDLASASLAADPLREPAVLLLMRALAATSQAPAALKRGRDYRHLLADETGLDPSSALDELERAVAGGDAGPAPAPAPPPAPAMAPGPMSTSLFGREEQVAALRRLLATQRLITISGPGGVGKSRLAVEVAHMDGARAMLQLAPVTDPAAVTHALAAAMNLTVVQGDVLASCVAVLGDGPGLLLIDNCEHLLEAVREMVEVVLASCPRLTVLATSRERLGLAAEYTFRLAPLPVPATGQDDPALDANPLRQVPSVAVFLDRAARARPGAPPTPAELRLIADIVRRLDGMPLAIELAAGRLSSFSLADLHRRLDRSLDLLGSGRTGGDDRHRTLRATVQWSYELLPKDAQTLFRHLSTFADGIDLDAAERLATDLGLNSDPGSVLAHLVDASMIDADLTAGTRYRMLETLRAFGRDRLVVAGEDGAADRHFLQWAVDFTAWVAVELTSEREPEADSVLRRELSNLRAAWRLARRRGSLDDAAAIVIGLFDAIAYRDLVELRGWAEELSDDPALATQAYAAAVLGTAAEAAYHRGDHSRADQLARRGLQLAMDDAGSWYCLAALSVAALARGAYADAARFSLDGADRAARPRENLGLAALARAYAGDLEQARILNHRSRATAVSPTLRSWAAYVDGEIETLDGRTDLAELHYLDAVELARASGATFLVGVVTVGLLSVRVAGGRISEALTGFRDVIDYFDRTGNWTHQWATLRNLANLLRRLGDDAPAAMLDAAADRAPDAPADNRSRGLVDGPPGQSVQVVPVPGRGEILGVARQAIARNLVRS